MLLLRKIYFYVAWLFVKSVGIQFISQKIMGVNIFLDTKTPGISKTLFVEREREIDMLQIIKDFMPRDAVVLDCGSNIGIYPALIASLLNDGGKIYSIEPDSRNWKVLKKNLEKIRRDGAEIDFWPVALSSESKRVKFSQSRASNLSFVLGDEVGADGKEIVEVEALSFSDLVREKGCEGINFIRMDVEGHEIEIFEGMLSYIGSVDSIQILFETHGPLYESDRARNALAKLVDSGLKPKLLVSAGSVQPLQFARKQVEPDTSMASDGFERGWYYDLDINDAIELIVSSPKCVRYCLLQKGVS